MATDRQKAMAYRQQKLIAEAAGKKADKFNSAIIGPVGYGVLKNGVKGASAVERKLESGQRLGNQVVKAGANDVVQKARLVNQFASQAAKTVVDDVQGVAKMFIKGFGH